MSENDKMYDTMEACLADGHDEAYCKTHVKAPESAPTGGDAKDPTVAAQLVLLKTMNADLRADNKRLTGENKQLKERLIEYNASVDGEIRARLYPKIKEAVPNIQRDELDKMKPQELVTFVETIARVDSPHRKKLNLATAADAKAAGVRVVLDEMPTMYGKTQKEILEAVGA